MPLTELAANLQMPLLEVASLLEKMKSTSLIEINGDPGQENVSITDAGRTVAELA